MFLRRAYAEWRVAVNYSGPDRGFNCERSDFSGAGCPPESIAWRSCRRTIIIIVIRGSYEVAGNPTDRIGPRGVITTRSPARITLNDQTNAITSLG
jgi:hypothetical protein